MRTTSNKKSPKARVSTVREKARSAVQRVAASDARRLPKPRVGFEKIVPILADIVAKYGADLGAGFDVERMQESLNEYQALEARYEAAVNELAAVEGSRLVHSSAAWMEALSIYEKARSLGRSNEACRGDVDPIVRFMKKGPRKPHTTVTPDTPVTTTGTTTTTP